jgi:hypothetical protein
MEGVWRKAKKALVGGLCVQLPAVAGDREDGASERRASDAVSLDSTAAAHVSAPNTPAATATAMATADASGPSALRRSKSGGKSSKLGFSNFVQSAAKGPGIFLFTAVHTNANTLPSPLS